MQNYFLAFADQHSRKQKEIEIVYEFVKLFVRMQNYFLAFADQQLLVSKKKSRLFMIFEM